MQLVRTSIYVVFNSAAIDHVHIQPVSQVYGIDIGRGIERHVGLPSPGASSCHTIASSLPPVLRWCATERNMTAL